MKNPCFIFIFFLQATLSFSQGTWTQKSNFGGSARWEAVGFSIGNKGYIGTGQDGSYTNDLWEYDPITDTWTQKSSLPGIARHSACCFSIGTKVYVGTGFSPASLADFWEWDQTNNNWNSKANYNPGIRDDCFAFSIGNKGYVGGGSVWNTSSYYNDFWEYDPLSNSWTQKANFPVGNRAEAVAFTIGNFGYVGIGYDGFSNFNDFWEYNPLINSWNAKANFPGTARYKATGFSIGTKGYIGTGSNGVTQQDFWEWDQPTNLWTQQANFGGGLRMDASAFSIGCKGYIGTGSNGSDFKDFWEFTPSTVSLNAVINSTSATICLGQSTTLTASGGISYVWNNGSTINPVTVSPTTTISYSVIASDSCGADTASITVNVILCSAPISVFSSSANTICMNECVQFLDQSSGSPSSWSWSFPGGNPSSSGQQNPLVCYDSIGIINVSLTVSNTNGSDTLINSNYITVYDCYCPELFLPNAFSPNGDNENEVLIPDGVKCIKSFAMTIYNRWGEKVFETIDVKKGWDGTFNGKKENTAVFVYYLDVTYTNGNTSRLKGNISLIR